MKEELRDKLEEALVKLLNRYNENLSGKEEAIAEIGKIVRSTVPLRNHRMEEANEVSKEMFETWSTEEKQ